MTSSLQLFQPDVCLISELIKTLVAQESRDYSSFHLVLPTKRLATYVTAELLRQRGGTILPPRIYNFREFIRLTLSPFAEEKCISNLHRRAEMLSLMQECKTIGAAHLHELMQIDREMQLFLQNGKTLKDLAHEYQERFFRDQKEDHQMLRLQEGHDVLTRFHDHLRAVDLCSEEEKLAREMARFVEKAPTSPYRNAPLSIIGITTLSPPEREALRAIAKYFTAEIWLSDFRGESYCDNAPLLQITHELTQEFPEKIRERPRSRTSPTYAEAVRCLDEERQWEEVILQIKKLLKSGVPSGSIALLLPQENKATPMRRLWLEKQNLAFNCAVGMSFSASELGKYTTLLFDFLEKRDLLSLYDLERHPYFSLQTLKDENGEQRRAWREGLAEEKVNIKLYDYKSDTSFTPWLQAVKTEFLAPLAKIKDFSSWSVFLHEKLSAVIQQSLEHPKESERQAAAALDSFIKDLALCPDVRFSHFNERLSFSREALREVEIRERGEPLRGVQILSIDEARGYPFEHVFILDMISGSFPKKAPSDIILNETAKKTLGLPGWKTLEAMEKITFLSLLRRVPHLYLFYYESADTLPSTFMNLAATSTHYQHRHAEFVSCYEAGAKRNQELPGQLVNDIISVRRPHSPTRFDQFIRCPYSHLLKSFDIERREWPRQEVDVRDEGAWLHAILEGLFRSGSFHNCDLPPWPSDICAENITTFLLERLTYLTMNLRLGFEPNSATILHLTQFSWPRAAAHFAKFLAFKNYQQPKTDFLEYKFTSDLRMGEIHLKFRGQIDALLDLGDFFLLTDYKRKSTPDAKDLKNGLASQLPFYTEALRQLKTFKDRPIVAGYWSVLKGEWTPGLSPESCREDLMPLGVIKKGTPNIEECLEALSQLYSWRIEQMYEHQAFVADDSMCGFCDLTNICRKNDVAAQDIFNVAFTLMEKLA